MTFNQPATDVFGVTPDGLAIREYVLKNQRGAQIRAIAYGAIITSILLPKHHGGHDDVVLGHDDLAGYLEPNTPYFGAVIGRYANRIANGQFALGGKTYDLVRNNGPNHLHGGVRGFDKVIWKGEPFATDRATGVRFRYTSPDGEEGYPGTLTAVVRYSLTSENELMCDYRATTTKSTPVNLTQHSYFNLAGSGSRDILGHNVMINADAFTPVGPTLIPTGEIAPVAGTPFDLRTAKPIGACVNAGNEQIRFALGYDHNFVLNKVARGLTFAARVHEPHSGRFLEVFTDQPGIQFYSGNFLDGNIKGKMGIAYQHRHGFCLETQHFPDSPNKTNFPSTILQPFSEYRTRTIYRFSLRPWST
jgi:aldose 1-epimerase